MTIPSCRKGDNDPFFSLKSRKSRLSGDYRIASWAYEMNQELDASYELDDLIVGEINGSEGTEIRTRNIGVETFITTKEMSVSKADFEISKDGTWESEISMVSLIKYPGGGWGPIEVIETSVSKESGNWSFILGKTEDYKSKERVLFNVLVVERGVQQTSTYVSPWGDEMYTEEAPVVDSVMTYSEGIRSLVYEIDMLKNKEIVLKQNRV